MIRLLRNLDCFTPEPRGVADVIVAGGRLVHIGKEVGGLPASLEVEEVDFDGRRAIPGLIDGHVHLTGGGGETGGARYRVPPVPLSRFTRGGATTVVGVLGTDDTTRSTADLVTAARALREEGISAFCHTGGYHVPPTTLTGSVRDDITFVEPIIGVGEIAISDHRSSHPTRDELLRLAADAHVAGLMSGKAGVLHLHLGDGKRGLSPVRECLDHGEVPARVFNPTHVNRRKSLFEEAVALTEAGCTIDVTAFPVGPDEEAWSAEDALLRYLDAGAPPSRITVSSDGGGCLPVFDADGHPTSMSVAQPGAVAECLRRLLGAGAPLERVLPAFTCNAADLLRLPSKGRLRAGADADLVVLDDDGRVRDVMARGEWHVRNGAVVRRGTFENTGEGGSADA